MCDRSSGFLRAQDPAAFVQPFQNSGAPRAYVGRPGGLYYCGCCLYRSPLLDNFHLEYSCSASSRPMTDVFICFRIATLSGKKEGLQILEPGSGRLAQFRELLGIFWVSGCCLPLPRKGPKHSTDQGDLIGKGCEFGARGFGQALGFWVPGLGGFPPVDVLQGCCSLFHLNPQR